VRAGVEAWSGRNAAFNPIRHFQSNWENPLPDQPIQSIDHVSALTEAGPFLVAITVE
jgi:hypothetical protein